MRRRLALAIAGVAAAAVVLFALPLALALKRGYEDDELLKLQRDTVAATREVDVTGARGDLVELPASEDRLAAYDKAGVRVSGSGPVRAPTLVRQALESGRLADRSAEGSLQVAVPLLSGERVSGAVLAVRDDSAVSSRTRRAWLALAGLAGLIVALSILAAMLLGRRLASPLEQLAGSARRLGEGDFSVRAPRSGVAEADAVAEALDTTARRLGDLLARERAFSADASHQLRTPLAALRLELEALELRGGAPAEAGRALAEVDRLQKTIDALLAAARDSGDRPQRADLEEVLRELEQRWHGPLATAGRPLRVSLGESKLAVGASPAVVGEILQILIENAYRHGAGEVSVTARPIQGSVAVDVQDEGPGFAGPAEELFARRVSSGDGLGIGLALARSLAQAEGGQVLVSESGSGPILTLLLPAYGGSEA